MPKPLFAKDDYFKLLRNIISPRFIPWELGGGEEEEPPTEPPIEPSLLKAVRISQGARDQQFQPMRPAATKPVSPLTFTQAIKDIIIRPLQEALEVIRPLAKEQPWELFEPVREQGVPKSYMEPERPPPPSFQETIREMARTADVAYATMRFGPEEIQEERAALIRKRARGELTPEEQARLTWLMLSPTGGPEAAAFTMWPGSLAGTVRKAGAGKVAKGKPAPTPAAPAAEALPPIPKATPTGPYSQEALNAIRQGQIRTAQDMAAHGATVSDIASELKISPEYVRGLLAAKAAPTAEAVAPGVAKAPAEAIKPSISPEIPPTKVAPIGSDQWAYMTMPQRVTAVKAAGLEGKVGSKNWADLTTSEKAALGRPAPPAVEAPGAIPKGIPPAPRAAEIEAPPGAVAGGVPPVQPPIGTSKTLQETDDFIAGFSRYLQSPESGMDWVKTLDLRKATLARRFSNYQQRVEQLVSAGGATDEALAQALKETMSGRLPGIETGIAEELTKQAQEAMFSRVYHYLANEPAELMSTAEALRNALLGKAIPQIPGIKGGSAYTRLMRIFGDNPEIMKILEQKTGLRDVIEESVLRVSKKYPPDFSPFEVPPSKPFGRPRLGEEPWKLIDVQDLRTPEQAQLAYAQLKSAIKQAETPPFTDMMKVMESSPIKSAFQDTIIPLHHRNIIVSALKEIGLTVQDIGNLIRANKASLDQSFGRQVTPLIARYPVKYLNAYVKAWAATLKGENAEKAWTSLMKEPIMRFYEERGWDYLRPLKLPPGVSQAKGVEEFGFAIGGERPIQKFTIGIPWVNFSQRGFVTGINDMLTSIMKDKYAGLLRYNEKIASGAVKLKPGEVLDIGKELDGFAHFLEDVSGRGRLGPLRDLAPAINSFFFSARLNLGRFFAPRHLFDFRKPEVMKEAWTDFALFAGSIVGIELLGEQLDLWEIGKQGWKKGKIRVGNTWIDPWGGYQQIARYAEEMLTGQYTSAATGRKYDVSRLEITKRFLLSKAAPLYGLARTAITGKRYTGEAFEPGSPRQLFDELAMLSVTDVADAFEHSGWLGGVISIPLAISGISLISARSKLDELAKQKFAGRGMDVLSPGEMQRLRNLPEARAIIEEEEKWRGLSAEQKIFKRLAELESWEAIPGMELTKEELKSYKQLGEELLKADVRELVASLEYRTATIDERDKMLQKISNTAREWARFKTKQQIWASGTTEARQKDLEFTLNAVDKQLGQLISATPEFTHEKPDVYDIAHELDASYKALLKGIPEESLKGLNIPASARSWLAKEKAAQDSDILPHSPLYKINADAKEGTTFEDYYEQWQKRLTLTDERELAEFDKKYPDANRGNLTRRELELLRVYNKLDKAGKTLFLKAHPEIEANPYQDWLKSHPKENAQLAIWGQAKLLTQEADTEARRLIKELDIPDSALPDLTLPPELSVKGYVQYLEQGEKFGYNSAEAKLLLAKDDKLREFLGREPVDTPVASLELKVKHRNLFDLRDAYSDKDSPEYLDDKVKDAQGLTARDRAQVKLKADNPQWVDDMRRIEAIEHEADEETVEAWVEHGKLAGQAPGFNAEEKLWLIDHPEVHQWALKQKLLTDDGSKWNEPVLRLDVQWRKEDAEYQAILDKYPGRPPEEIVAAKAYLAGNEAYRKDRRRREAYQKGLTDQVEDYVSYYELPDKGFRRERFLIEKSGFAKAFYDAKQISDLPDPAKVPAVQYDDIYDQFPDQFDEIEGNGKPESKWFEPDPIKRAARDKALRFDPNGKYTKFGLAELRRRAYGSLVPEKHIEAYVAYYKLPRKGYRQERFLLENPDFAEVVGLKVPDRVPLAQYDDIYDKYQPQFDRLEEFGDSRSKFYIEDPGVRELARKAMRFDVNGRFTEFGLAEMRRKAYGLLVPERHINDYVVYYRLIGEGKPENYEEMTGTDRWYDDDWWMMEHPAFYKEVWLGILRNDRKDYRKVPTREVFALYVQYQALPKGNARTGFRAKHPDLDAWGKLALGWSPLKPTSKSTPKGRSAFELLEEQGLLGALSRR